MYIPNFMKPAWHNCINKYVWQTFLCKNKIFKKHYSNTIFFYNFHDCVYNYAYNFSYYS